MDHNPWSPTSPGKHGYMQVGLGQDKARFNTPEIRHIFVGNGGRFKYSGKYEVSRVEPLSVDEWNTLPDKVHSFAHRHLLLSLIFHCSLALSGQA